MDEELVQQILQPYLSEQAELSLWEQLQAFYHAVSTNIDYMTRSG